MLQQLTLTEGDFGSNDYETLLSLDEAVRKKKKGLSKEELDQLPSFTYKSSNSDESEYKDCSVCFDSFKSREKITALVCSHKYHRKCIKTWLKVSANEP